MDEIPGSLALSELDGIKVLDVSGLEIGELGDVVATTTQDPPVVTAFFIDRDDGQLAASWAQVAEIDVDGERLLLGVPLEAVKPASLRPDELSLVDALLDNQVLDMRRRAFVRVQDVVLETQDDHLVVAGVDASPAALAPLPVSRKNPTIIRASAQRSPSQPASGAPTMVPPSP